MEFRGRPARCGSAGARSPDPHGGAHRRSPATDLQARPAGNSSSIHPGSSARILFDELGFRVVKKTKTSRSTDADVLTDTRRSETEHPLPRLILEYRELAKLRGTYVDPLPQMVSSATEPSARQLSPDGRGHGTLELVGSQHPEHPDPDRAGTRDPPGLRGPRRGPRPDRRRLLSDRAARARPSCPGTKSCSRPSARTSGHPRVRGGTDRRNPRGRSERSSRGPRPRPSISGSSTARVRSDSRGRWASRARRPRTSSPRTRSGTPASTRFMKECVAEAESDGTRLDSSGAPAAGSRKSTRAIGCVEPRANASPSTRSCRARPPI